MRILVTGGAGFIGSNFVHYALHLENPDQQTKCCSDQVAYSRDKGIEGAEVLILDKLTYAGRMQNLVGADKFRGFSIERLDICKPGPVNAAFSRYRPQAVVHFAAESHVDRSIESGLSFAQTNFVGTQVLLDAARKTDVERFLHISTDEVYGSIEKGSFTESSHLNPSSPYSASKAASDLLVSAHRHTYGLNATITRCTNNYGPRQHEEKLIPKAISAALKGQKIPVYGTGRNVRDWLYVKDHCAALAALLREKSTPPVLNIGSRTELANVELIRAILTALGRPDALIDFVADRPGHDWRYSLDDQKMRALGWRPKTDLVRGLDYTISWIKGIL